MALETLLGYNTGSSQYDYKRHLNLIFTELMTYKLYYDQRLTIQIIQYAKSLHDDAKASKYILEDVLNPYERNYLKTLRTRYGISEVDFQAITSGKGLTDGIIKTPAGYGRSQNITLLTQMALVRAYMQPQNNNAMMQINSMIYSMGQGMAGNINENTIRRILDLSLEAMRVVNAGDYDLKPYEDYVIARIS